MKNGVYSLSVLTPPVIGRGIVVVRDHCINGGDAQRLYQGVFEQEQAHVTGVFTSIPWVADADAGPLRPTAGTPDEFALTGTADRDGFHLVGHGKHGAVVEVTGRFVAALREPCVLPAEQVVDVERISAHK